MAGHRYWRVYVPVNSLNGGNGCACVELELRASIGGADQTGSGTALASSSGSGAAANAFDNSAATTWGSSGVNATGPHWIGYDFGAGVTKDIVQVAWTAMSTRTDNAPIAVDVQYSDDGTNWTTRFSVTGMAGTWSNSEQKVWSGSTVSSTPHRYWRLKVNANNGYSSGNVSCAELELRESIGGADATGAGTASASGQLSTSFTPAMAFDNSTSSYWFSNTSATFPKFLTYDFGAGVSKNIVEVAYTCPLNETRSAPTDWELQWSDDNASWSTLFRVQDSAHSSLGQKVYSASDYAELGTAANQAWRLVTTAANTGGAIIQITELQMFVAGSATSECVGGKGYASSTFDGSVSPAKAFDGTLTGSASMWGSRTVAEWLAYRFPSGKAITTIGITNPPATVSGFATQAPKDFSLQYWDGSAWQTAWSVAGVTGWTGNQTRYFNASGETTAPVASAARPTVFVST